ncbi:polypeptide N-acetylgalactosaminyltransferase 16 [Anabrus simplex]|uniref:polypeptide N-acetylgalactosaminyltransferase 16 n=1 Tax=Anabrus simplex TaxID=316456 RepID=UPI0035A3759E
MNITVAIPGESAAPDFSVVRHPNERQWSVGRFPRAVYQATVAFKALTALSQQDFYKNMYATGIYTMQQAVIRLCKKYVPISFTPSTLSDKLEIVYSRTIIFPKSWKDIPGFEVWCHRNIDLEFFDLERAPPALMIHESVYVAQGQKKNQDTDPFSRHAFNVVVSNKLRSDRSIPDTRHHRCLDLDYSFEEQKTVSVVITFHNEARSALLRTVVSVLNRTPSDLLEEILLVDDGSSNEEDGTLLASLPKVKIIRNAEREGLIRSRIRGAQEAKGDYLMFLDSHCEVNVGWLEPLLSRIIQEPLLVASPVIDVIDMDTFQYRSSSSQLKGGFDWSLHFKWVPLSSSERAQREDPTEPFMSPVIAGGLFLIDKDWFIQLGAFDPGLEIWGAENLEISLKTWLCGGKLEVVPCSRVGHVFRKKHPYTFPSGNANTYLRNTKRIAEIWLDDHKRFFYEARPNANEVDAGSLEKQLKIKQQLDCKPFQWYLENVFPELKLPNEENTAFGQLKQGSMCLQAEGGQFEVKLAQCSDSVPSQHAWAFSGRTLAIQLNKMCMTVPNSKKHPILQPCRQTSHQKWSRHGRAVVNLSTGQCLESGITSEVVMSDCRRGAVSQQWDFTVELQTQDEGPVRIT